ncbi:hypothetical protein JCM10207_000042 [Rhodosporidiobolus poonsookiae]
MAGLETASSGDNPFTEYLDRLDSNLYPAVPAGNGFSRRAYGLVGVCAYGCIVSAAYCLVLVCQRRRRSKLCVARKTDGYLTLNLHFWVPVGGILGCASMLAYTVLQYLLFTRPHSTFFLYSINTFRTFSWIPLVLHGYTVTASASQACLVVGRRASLAGEAEKSAGPLERRGSVAERMRMPGPRVANAAFWAGLACISLALLLPDILFSISWHGVYLKISALEKYLQNASSAWTADQPQRTTMQALLEVSQLYQALLDERAKNCSFQSAVVYSLIIVPLFLAFITFLSSLLLHLLLRAQIRTRSRLAAAHSTLLAELHSFASPTPSLWPGPSAGSPLASPRGSVHSLASLHAYGAGAGAAQRFEVTLATVPGSPALASEAGDSPRPDAIDSEAEKPSPPLVGLLPSSLPASPAPALKNASRFARSRPGTGDSNARRSFAFADEGEVGMGEFEGKDERGASEGVDGGIGELKRAERELGVCALTVLTICLFLSAENIWNVARVVPTAYVDLSWTEIELSDFLPPAIYALLYSLAPTLLLLNALFSSPSPSPSSSSSLCPLTARFNAWRAEKARGRRNSYTAQEVCAVPLSAGGGVGVGVGLGLPLAAPPAARVTRL